MPLSVLTLINTGYRINLLSVRIACPIRSSVTVIQLMIRSVVRKVSNGDPLRPVFVLGVRLQG